MVTASKGNFKTAGGLNAVVAQLRCIAGEWVWLGSVECPSTLALTIQKWHVDGSCSYNPRFTLTEKIDSAVNGMILNGQHGGPADETASA